MSYNNSKIYCIRNYETDDIYIGSTTQSLSRRMSDHKSQFKQYLKGTKNYVTSMEVLVYEDAYIELIESYPCENKDELRKQEGKYIREMKCVNRCIAGRTRKEYYEENKEEIAKKAKVYYEKNKAIIVAKRALYRQTNREKIKARNRKYGENNRDKRNTYAEQYRTDNKDTINAKQNRYYHQRKEQLKQKHVCECGSVICLYSKSLHLKSKKHKAWKAAQPE